MSESLNPNALRLSTDVLVLGTGGAGLMAALAARRAGAEVFVVSKMGRNDHNCTIRSWGGFTFATPAHEDELFRQVVEAGGFLNDQRLVEVFARETPQRTQDLLDLSVELQVLDRADELNRLGVTRLRVTGPNPGLAMTVPLRQQAEARGVRFVDQVMVSTLLQNAGQVGGAVGVDLAAGKLVVIAAKAVILATGGGACLFERTDNPAGTTGDGIALAYDAGAEVVDLELLSFQIPEKRFAALRVLKQVPDEAMLGVGGAHYFMGGVRIDAHARTTLPGLYAAGEVAGGLFGAGRLGGAAMADLIVFGTAAGREAAAWAANKPLPEPDTAGVEAARQRLSAMLSDNGMSAPEVTTQLRALMWRHCGTMKTRQTLDQALVEIARLETLRPRLGVGSAAELRAGIECLNLLTLARLIAAASRLREESRGSFWRLDFPEPDNAHWIRNICWRRVNGQDRQEIRAPTMTRLTVPTTPRIGPGCFGYLIPV